MTKSVDIDLDSLNGLVLVAGGDFAVNMVKNIGCFDKVITADDLEKVIIKNELTDQVSSVKNRIGLKRLRKHIKISCGLDGTLVKMV